MHVYSYRPTPKFNVGDVIMAKGYEGSYFTIEVVRIETYASEGKLMHDVGYETVDNAGTAGYTFIYEQDVIRRAFPAEIPTKPTLDALLEQYADIKAVIAIVGEGDSDYVGKLADIERQLKTHYNTN